MVFEAPALRDQRLPRWRRSRHRQSAAVRAPALTPGVLSRPRPCKTRPPGVRHARGALAPQPRQPPPGACPPEACRRQALRGVVRAEVVGLCCAQVRVKDIKDQTPRGVPGQRVADSVTPLLCVSPRPSALAFPSSSCFLVGLMPCMQHASAA